MKPVLLLLASLSFSGICYGQQIIEMIEEDVDLKVQTWHYSRYEKSKEVSWILKVKDGEGVYEAEFLFDGNRVKAAYTDDGFILWEEVYFEEKNIPEIVTGLLDYRIVKYKIDRFVKFTEFDETRKPITEEYQVVAFTKTGGEVVYWFDKDINLIPEKKISEVAKR
jgi:hypothetical protein